MHDIRLSRHFMLSEFIRSSTASAKKIDNTPGSHSTSSGQAGSPQAALEVVSNLQQLCIHVLEPLREHFDCPVTISSGYRSPSLNRAVGGVATSQHMTGEAADIRIPDEATGKRWFLWMKSNLHFDQLIWEQKSTPTSTSYWIHISFRQGGPQRQQVIENHVKNR